MELVARFLIIPYYTHILYHASEEILQQQWNQDTLGIGLLTHKITKYNMYSFVGRPV